MNRIDSPSAASLLRMLASIDELRRRYRHPRTYALLDMSFAAPAMRDTLARQFPDPLYLFRDHYPGEGLEHIDTWLVETSQADTIPMLATLCAGQPMLSFLMTPAIPQEVQKHLRRQLEAKDDKGQTYILRWADTRCLPMLYRCFEEHQQERLMAGIFAWIFPGRDGETEIINGHPESDIANAEPALPYTLTKEQSEVLRAAARPDALLSLIADRPHLYGTLSGLPSQHHLVTRAALSKVADQAATAEVLRVVTMSLEIQGLLQV